MQENWTVVLWTIGGCEAVRSRFVITGAPGSGKTLVLRELVNLEFLGIDEPAREILA
jgi:predicted ATPase